MSSVATVHRLVEAQVERTPDAEAVSWDGGRWSFGELDRRASLLAEHLVRLGVRPERLVAVSMEPSPLLLVSMLAIWKAGGAYVPIDASLPRAVAEDMVSDAGITVLIANGAVAVELDHVDVVDLAALDLDAPDRDTPDLSAVRVVPGNLAYCVFTSGSTGKPKLVAVAHESFANHAFALRDQLQIGPHDRFLQSTAMAFDAALEEIMPAWLAGGSVVMPAQRKFTSHELTDLVNRLAITMVSLPSAYWHLWVDELVAGALTLPPSLRVVFIGGDKILVEKLAAWYRLPGADRVTWVSDYGPTETSISVALHHPARDGIGASDGSAYALVSLGRAFASAELYVLDDDLQPLPLGEPGDLWVGGPPVTRGYYGAPSMTADRYRPDPQGRPGARMYRTGDRAAFAPDGTLSFLGRSDRQVKIRGSRVELGQVESALHQLDGVRDAVVVVVDGATAESASGSGHSTLVAYVEGQVTESDVRAGLAERLSEAMRPSVIVLMDRIPRSPLNGKVARAQLPPIVSRPDGHVDSRGPGPMTALERAVAVIVGDVHGVAVNDRQENFFTRGGDSLQSMQILSRVTEVTGVALTFEQFRAAPHVAGVAEAVRQRRAAGTLSPSAPVRGSAGEDDRQPASSGQQALWYLDQVYRGAPLYGVPVCYRISGPLDVDRLDRALSGVVARHSALRTVLVQQGGAVWQHIGPPAPVRTESRSARDLDDAAAQADAAAGRAFDLATGPLLRSTLFAFGDEWLWLLDVHHAVFDAWSLAVLWRELTALYEGRALPEVGVQFADYVHWQRQWLAGPEAAAQREYWAGALGGAPPAAPLGARRADARAGTAGFAVPVPPDAIDVARVEQLARDCGSTAFAVLLAAFVLTLGRTSGTDEPVVGLPVACRHRPGTEDVVGYLANTVAVRVSLGADLTGRALVAEVDAALARALTHQDLPFAEAVEAATRSGRPGDSPVYGAMFAFQSTPLDDLAGLTGLRVTEHSVHPGTAKAALTWTARYDPAPPLGDAAGPDPAGPRLAGEIEFASDAFDEATAAQWQDTLLAVLALLLAEPDSPVSPSDRHL